MRSLSSTHSVRRQLQRRVMILGLTSILGFTLALVLTLMFEFQRLEVELEDEGRSAAIAFDSVLGDIRQDLQATAGAISTLGSDERELRILFRRALDRQSPVLELALVSPDGEVRVQRRRVFQQPELYIDPSPWREDLERGQSHIGVVEFEDVDEASVPFVSLAVPVIKDRELDAALLARVDLSSLWSEVTSRQVGEKGYVFITDQEGQILVYKDLLAVRNGLTLQDLVGRGPREISEPGLDFYRGLNLSWVAAASLPLDDVSWYAVIEQPAREALKPLMIRSGLLSIPIILLLVLVSGIFLFTRRRIVYPLQQLQAAVTALREGRLDHQIDTDAGFDNSDELGTLATAFNQLAHQLRNNIERLEGRLTELKRTQNELQEARDNLERRVQERTADLKRANEEMRSLVYLVSHDLRAPLINLKGFAGELRDAQARLRSHLTPLLTQLDEGRRREITTYLDEEVPESLGFIESAASRMDSFTSALLKLSRAGHREMLPEEVDVDLLVKNLLKASAYQIEQQGVKVTTKALPTVIADPLALEQVFGNLLTNAIAYLSEDRPGLIEIQGEKTAEQTLYRVKDNGRGISDEDLPKVFQPFRRLGRTDRPGEGMGLTYAQALIRRHRGRIWCRSTLGQGSEFVFSLPSDPIPDEPLQNW